MVTIFGLNIKLRNERWPRAESFYHNVNQWMKKIVKVADEMQLVSTTTRNFMQLVLTMIVWISCLFHCYISSVNCGPSKQCL